MPGIRTYESLSGFIASTPNTTPTEAGKPRFYAHAGQNQFHKEQDGSYTKTGTEYVPIVAFDKVAEELAARFAKGDNFVAEGHTRPYSYQKDGQTVAGDEFVVWKVGHDAARTRYQVQRLPHAARNSSATGVTDSELRREPPDEFTSRRPRVPAAPRIAM